MAGGTLKLDAIQTFGRNLYGEDYADPAYRATTAGRSNSWATILRAIVSAPLAPRLEGRFSAEAAFNRAHERFALTLDGLAIELPADQVQVGENRGELSTELGWRPTPRFSMVTTLAWEISRIFIRQPGMRVSRAFAYPKPRVELAFSPDPSTSLRVMAERRVGQLDFADFVASASAETLVLTGGNPALLPERKWTIEAALDHSFGQRGHAGLAVSHSWIGRVIDYLPLPGGIDAIGNIGSGRRWQAKANASLPLGGVGIRGGVLTGELVRRWSRVTDPVTGELRPLSREAKVEGSVHFVEDLPAQRLSWGADYVVGKRSLRYRLREQTRTVGAGRFTLFAEFKPEARWRIRTEVQAGDRTASTERLLYLGDRSGPLGGRQVRTTQSSVTALLRASYIL
jgi:hypothetical protein